ncbi:MAG: hypothetical protein U0132_03290 [Gemmatimonadaceae bacterium]
MTSFLRDGPAQTPTPPATTIKDGDLRTPLALDDFMMQLGLVMRLPPKPSEVQADVAAPVATVRKSGTRLWVPAAATALALAVVGAKLRPPAPVVVPHEILGVWETPDARYAGRQIVFTDHSVVQQTANGVIGPPERIAGIATTQRGETLSVTLRHESEGAMASLSLAHVSEPVEHLVLRNPVGVPWYRVQDSATTRVVPSQGTSPTAQILPGKKAWEH